MHKRFRHLCLALAALIAAGTLLAALIPAAEAATYKKGSSGAVVSQIQTKLKNWGYYAGDVDGIYGSATERAVRAFQRKNGLTADGKAGAQTLEALGLPADSSGNSGGSGGMTGAQVDLLARLISGQFNEPVAESAYRAARDALNGVDPSGGAIYYFNPSTATSAWIWSRPLITVIGKHRFCS